MPSAQAGERGVKPQGEVIPAVGKFRAIPEPQHEPEQEAVAKSL
jgi:hypothetical protein